MAYQAGPDVSIDDSRDLYIEYEQAQSETGGTGATSGSHGAEDIVKARTEAGAPVKFGADVTIYDPGLTAFLRGQI